MSWQIVPAARFAEFAAEWDVLQRLTTDTPFFESDFVEPLMQVFGRGDELLALRREHGRATAAAIVRPLGGGRWETFQPSQLPLGPWIAPAGDGVEPLAQSLLRALPGLPLSLGVTQLDPRLASRPEPGPTLRVQDYVSTSFIDVAGTFDDYWNARGKNLRQNLRKQRNKLQADEVRVEMRTLTDGASVASAIADFGRLESAGWKGGAGSAIHADNDQGRFYREMLARFCSRGRARIVECRFDDQVVAMDLCIDNGPTVVILKTAYDEAWRQVSPSTLMRHDEFAAWWAEGRYRRIEFYGKTMEWHTRWSDDARLLYHATAYRWPWLAWLRERLVRRLPAPTQKEAVVAPLAGPRADMAS